MILILTTNLDIQQKNHLLILRTLHGQPKFFGQCSGPNLDLLCIQQSDAALTYVKIMESFILRPNT